MSFLPTVPVAVIAQAIAQFEGYAPGKRAWTNNNPGNLRDPSSSIWPEFPHDAAGFVQFPDADTGWYWLQHQIELDMVRRGLSLWEFINKYAPSSENNTRAYYDFINQKIAGAAGAPPDTPSPPEPEGVSWVLVAAAAGLAASVLLFLD